MPYTSINDAPLQRQVSLADAYRILALFIERYNARGESSTVALLTDTGLLPDGTTSDPAQLDDFLACAEEVLQRERPTH
jgi:hypothetical protein